MFDLEADLKTIREANMRICSYYNNLPVDSDEFGILEDFYIEVEDALASAETLIRK